MTFGKRLRDFREKADMTMEALGKGLGTDGADCGKQTVYGWEKDKHFPRVDQLLLICRRLNITPNDLLLDQKDSLTMKSINGLEGNLVMMFRILNEQQRDDVLAHVNNIIAKGQTEPSVAAPFHKKKEKAT